MDFKLNSVDFIQIGATSPRTMKLLPAASGRVSQKVVIGDSDGVLHCFSMKRGEVNYTYKTLPGSKILALDLGGAVGTVQDKVYVACGNEIRGFNKKGKQFLGFDTNLAENVQVMCVSGNDLMVCSNFVYSHFVECRDKNYFLAADKINDLLILPTVKFGYLVPILACQDRVIRILRDSQCLYEVEVSGPASTLALAYGDGGDEGNEVLYGTLDGTIGCVTIGSSAATHRWILRNTQSLGGIVCFENYDILGDVVKDLIVGRDDGRVEIYSYGEGESPKLKHTHCCTESVTSVRGGNVSSSSYKEIVVATYSGWVLGLTTEPLDKFQGIQSSANDIAQESRHKIQLLRSELEELQQQVLVEREKFQARAQESSGFLSSAVQLDINDKFGLCQEDASYILSLETLAAIDHVLLQSSVPIDLLDVEKNSAVVSFSKCDPESGNYLLATYRCQANTTRLEVKVRTIEGQYGTLRVYVTPRLQPKCSQLRQYQIKPLSLHQRVRSDEELGPLNSLTLRGQFSLAEVHSWIAFCLPELPDRPPSANFGKYTYVSTFLHTKLHCNYRKGEAVFKSENLSTISILKDVLTKQATTKKIRLDISCDVDDYSIEHTLRLIHPLLEHQLDLAQKVQFIEPLKELRLQEGDGNFLTPEYEDIFKKSAQLLEEYKKQPSHLERLYGMITDLYIDKFKFKGFNVKGRVPTLLEILDNYDQQELSDFFNLMA